MHKDDELILSLTKENFQLKKEAQQHDEARTAIRNILYCIGGPLNDNKDGYTKAQLVNFGRIAQYVND